MGFATLIGFPSLGITIVGLVEENPWGFEFNWLSPYGFVVQVIAGLLFGILAGYSAWWMINRPQLKSIKMKYGILIHSLKLSVWEILFLSFSAGVGEEFLFRGVIQPYWGVWITAVFFVAIHGYLDPRDKKMLSYGLLMTVLIGILGYMKIYLGILAPMAAHFMIDVVLLYLLSNDKAFDFVSAQPSFIMREFNPENFNDKSNPESPEIEVTEEDDVTNG